MNTLHFSMSSSYTLLHSLPSVFFFTDTPPTEISTLSLHDALPIWRTGSSGMRASRHTAATCGSPWIPNCARSEEHTSELQSRGHLVCRLLLEKKKQRSTPPSPSSEV